ncbi:helix-turn-helix transcriptional regulator [Paractinoplanes rishiriensis]|uniref:AraC family transcriptional regulator n=1 Tax=Paractinoplanes rishiriensis TaxID=1050105 RepID=A0A919MVE5_9ACTN|nr:AraC family transcriptional regulator [Actinoplanes rishiriensis]GIF01332.1 AraC family transcriptional regulator [Actinoplanes rishiriensis]
MRYTGRMPAATSDDPSHVPPDDPGGIDAELRRVRMGRFEELVDSVNLMIFPVRWTVAPGARELPVEFTAVRLGGLTFSTGAVQGDVSTSADERGGYHVIMALNGSLRSEHGAVRARITPHLAAVYPPSGTTTTTWTGPHNHPFSVKVDKTLLEEHLTAHLGHPVARPIKLADSLVTATGPGHTWAGLARLIFHDAEAGFPLARYPIIRSRLHDALVSGLLLAVEHPHRQESLTPATPRHPRPVKQAIDLIEAYPDRPLPITTIARMVGVSARALQIGFRRHVGVTPTEYARRVRLARAHDDLRTADPSRETVSAVAHRWGFLHLGRFAAAYRDAYGTTPSKTLRKDT